VLNLQCWLQTNKLQSSNLRSVLTLALFVNQTLYVLHVILATKTLLDSSQTVVVVLTVTSQSETQFLVSNAQPNV